MRPEFSHITSLSTSFKAIQGRAAGASLLLIKPVLRALLAASTTNRKWRRRSSAFVTARQETRDKPPAEALLQ